MMNFSKNQCQLIIPRKTLLCSSLLIAFGLSACGGKTTPDAVEDVTIEIDAPVETLDPPAKTNADGCAIKRRKDCTDRLSLTAADFSSRVGTLKGSSRMAAPGTAKGFLIFGPLAALEAGNYTFTLNYELDAPADLKRKEMDSYSIIGSLGGETTVFKKGQLDASSSTLNLDVELLDHVEKVQFRVYYNGRSTLSVASGTIEAKT